VQGEPEPTAPADEAPAAPEERREPRVEHPLRNILLTLQWDGTAFSGWQFQNAQRTVQGELTAALERMVRHPVKPTASSRTDAGVHGAEVPVTFETNRPIPLPNFVKGLNTALPDDVSILAAREIPLGWRARDMAVAKTYTYRLQLGPRRALSERYAWSLKRDDFDLDAVREAASHLIGEHDFSAFRAALCDAKSTRRCIHSLEVLRDDTDLVSLVITGNAFLRNMVRIIAGTLVDVGLKRRPATWVAEVLAAGDRRRSGQTAPARGLTLTKVHFEGYPRLGKLGPEERLLSLGERPDKGGPGEVGYSEDPGDEDHLE
jgi:tRNA pseudouridine38-40 synthase